MKPTETLKQMAFRNSIGSIRLDRAFPLNLFKESWADFLFFESDMIFEPEFITVKNALMAAEGSHICCLVNLGANIQEIYDNPPAIYLDGSIDSIQYMSLLRGDASANAWLYLVDRYVCASDVGEWCIYCEKENDVAVIALRSETRANEFASAIKLLQATSVKFASQNLGQGAFQFSKLTQVWRSSLIAQYSS